MAMIDLTNNQNTQTPAQQEKKQGVAQGKVVKESLGEQIYKSLIPEDPKTMAVDFLLKTVIPGIKKLAFDGISNFFKLTPQQPANGYQNYAPQNYIRPAANPYYQSGSYQVLRIQWATYQEAADVLAALEHDIQAYHVVSVASYYEYSRCGTVTRIDYAYGWRDLRTAAVYEASDKNGWFIDLPPVSRIGG